jgi:3-methyladenine DNA glycosylase/8-oxoguanine DNA glycosylase
MSGDQISVEAWGPGAEWLLDHASEFLGLHDDPAAFRPINKTLARLHRAMPGLRLGRSRAVFETILPTILEQKISGAAARRSYRALIAAHGEPAPGPGDLRLQPDPALLAALPYHDFHPFGIERKRADVIRAVAVRASRLETIPDDGARAEAVLTSFPGIGAWTSAIVRAVALGDPDAVEVGDYHLPNRVAWVLAREPRADDARMLELLEPYRGQRARAIRLIEASGIQAPRYGPRTRLTSIAGI